MSVGWRRLGEGVAWLAYAAVTALAHAIVALLAAISRFGEPARRRAMLERLGRYPRRATVATQGPTVWLHAASVGEVHAAEALLVEVLNRLGAGARAIVTCQTATGRALAARWVAAEVHTAPLDSGYAVSRAIRRFRPSIFVFVETEIWPRLLRDLAAAGVPTAMVSARISEASFRRYRWLRNVFAPALASLGAVCARDPVSAERLVTLGAPAKATVVCGDLKLDAFDETKVAATRAALDPPLDGGAGYVLAISTHAGEESVVLEAFLELRRRHRLLRLVLAPRHPRRCAEVRALAEARAVVELWSMARAQGNWEVLVVDTTGELRGFMSAAVCGFVGGTLVAVGGHNLVEPAMFGLPVAVGPHLENVRHQAELLANRGALHIVDDAPALVELWSTWLSNPAEARAAGAAARDAVTANRGALSRTLAAIEPLLESCSAAKSGSPPS